MLPEVLHALSDFIVFAAAEIEGIEANPFDCLPRLSTRSPGFPIQRLRVRLSFSDQRIKMSFFVQSPH